jgi:alpha-D-ribose 1-methylphosphonate 5-triphosphate synthase subunit PhnL
VNIARGLIADRPLVLMDEPTASLDARNRDVVIALIREKRAAGAGILGIFHDADVREAVATRIVDVADFRAPIAA